MVVGTFLGSRLEEDILHLRGQGVDREEVIEEETSGDILVNGNPDVDIYSCYQRTGKIVHEGGQGVIFELENGLVAKEYYHGRLRPDEDINWGELGEIEKGAQREIGFLERARADGREDVARLVDWGFTGNNFKSFVAVMREEKGKTLDKVIASEPFRSVSDCVELVSKVATVLEYAHGLGANGFTHRDLSPRNVMVRSDGSVVVLDWASGKVGSGNTLSNTMIGTPGFSAPEVLGGRTIKPYSDVYSLGRLMMYGLTGNDEIVDRSEFRNVDSRLVDVMFKACSLDPSKRYQDVCSFRSALDGSLVERVAEETPSSCLIVRDGSLRSILFNRRESNMYDNLSLYALATLMAGAGAVFGQLGSDFKFSPLELMSLFPFGCGFGLATSVLYTLLVKKIGRGLLGVVDGLGYVGLKAWDGVKGLTSRRQEVPQLEECRRSNEFESALDYVIRQILAPEVLQGGVLLEDWHTRLERIRDSSQGSFTQEFRDAVVERLMRIMRERGLLEEFNQRIIYTGSSLDFSQPLRFTPVEAGTHGEALAKLRRETRDQGSIAVMYGNVQRQFSIEENLQARLKQPNLWNIYLDSCTGFATEKDTRRLGIIPVCKQLATLPEGFSSPYLSLPFSEVTAGNSCQIFDLSRYKPQDGEGIEFKYNSSLTRDEALMNELWLAMCNGKRALLEKVVGHVFENRTKAMGIYVDSSPSSDRLRAAYVLSLGGGSSAYGYYNLDNNACLLRASPQR